MHFEKPFLAKVFKIEIQEDKNGTKFAKINMKVRSSAYSYNLKENFYINEVIWGAKLYVDEERLVELQQKLWDIENEINENKKLPEEERKRMQTTPFVKIYLTSYDIAHYYFPNSARKTIVGVTVSDFSYKPVKDPLEEAKEEIERLRARLTFSVAEPNSEEANLLKDAKIVKKTKEKKVRVKKDDSLVYEENDEILF